MHCTQSQRVRERENDFLAHAGLASEFARVKACKVEPLHPLRVIKIKLSEDV